MKRVEALVFKVLLQIAYQSEWSYLGNPGSHIREIILARAADELVECGADRPFVFGGRAFAQIDAAHAMRDRHLAEELIVGQRSSLAGGGVVQKVLPGSRRAGIGPIDVPGQIDSHQIGRAHV